MRCTAENQNRGMRWTPFSYLEDLDYADDLALLSHTHSHIQEKTRRLKIFAKQVGLNISRKRTEVKALNNTNRSPVLVDNEDLPYTDMFAYLGRLSAVKGGGLSTFHTKSLCRILPIFWPETISNKDLLERCGTVSMATILMRRRWRWIGHVTRQEGMGSRDGAVVRALASHQCGPDSTPAPCVICGLSFVVGSRPCSERFFSG